MPRGNGMFIVPTYKAGLTQIFPSLVKGLEGQGFYKDLHYFIGRKPPKSWKWPEPYQPPKKYDNYIIFWNGCGINLISHDKKDDGRGLNTDFEIGDESALLDKKKLDANTLPTLRGSNKRAFKDVGLWCSRLHATSMPLTQQGQWFLDMEEACKKEPQKIHFLAADCRFNMENLHPDYIENARTTTLKWIFEAEYLNIKPRQIKGGFYPLLSEDKHTYDDFDYTYYDKMGLEEDCRGDADLVASQPFILGVDWGAAINCLVTNQNIDNELRALKSMYVLGDNQEVQSDLFAKFIRYYRHHKTKTIYMYYDNTGNNDTGLDKYNRAQLAQKQLRAAGWTVYLRTIGGRNPSHNSKHTLWNLILQEKDSRFPKFRMNKTNCKELWISMFNATAKAGKNGEVHKDKSSERSTIIPRQHATDLSDAEDHVIYGMFKDILSGFGRSLPGSTFYTQ